MPPNRAFSESGVVLDSRLPVPKQQQRESEPRLPRPVREVGDDSRKRMIGVVAGATLGALVLGFVVRPMILPDKRVGELRGQVAEATKSGAAQKGRADSAEKAIAEANAVQTELEKKL